MLRTILIAVVVLVLLAGAWVRLAPSDPAVWNVLPAVTGPGDTEGANSFAAVRQITTTPEGILKAVQTAAEATPRTSLLAGSVAEGQMTFVTRSALWGFPDYTTVGVVDGQLVMLGRARFGASDLGVNKARLQGWLAQLGPLVVPLA